MKTLLYIILLAVLTLSVGIFLPQWWMVGPVSFLLAIVFDKKILTTGLISFLIVAIIWSAYAMYLDGQNNHILTSKIGALFQTGSLAVAIISGLIGGVVSLMAGLTGWSFKKILT